MRELGQTLTGSSLGRFIALSLAGHLVLFTVFLVKPFIIPTEPLNLKSSVRVDLVALPDKLEPPTKKPAAPVPVVPRDQPPKPTPPKPPQKPVEKAAQPKVNLKQTKDSQLSAIAKLKQLEALEKLQETKDPPQKEVEYKGNIVSEGSSLTGLSQLEYDRYLGSIESKIRNEWNLPQWLKDSEYRAEATVLIDEKGLVIHKQVTRSSGNDIFDSAVLTAIDRASPFPEPPARLRGVLATRGVVFRFPQ